MPATKSSPVSIAWLVATLAAATCAAQDSATFPAGTRFRVTAPGVSRKPIVGTLLVAGERDIVLAASPSDRTPIPRASITRLERSLRPSRRATGALAGFILGLAAMGAKTLHDGGCNDGCNGSNVAAAVVAALPVAALGALVAPGERWEVVGMGHRQSRATASRAGRHVRLVPEVGRRTGLTVVATF
jgi:hypothetical protein